MKQTTIDKINLDRVLDIMYEPSKNRYSMMEAFGTRKQITRKEFFSLANKLRSIKNFNLYSI